MNLSTSTLAPSRAHAERRSPQGQQGPAGCLSWIRMWGLALGCLVIVSLAIGCGPGPASKSDKTVDVEVTTPITFLMLDYQDFTGRLDAFLTVPIRSRVTGYVDEVPFAP